MGDDFIISQDQDAITSRVKQLADGTYDAGRLAAAFKLGKNYAKFILGHSQALQFDDSRVVPVNFRPFDARWTYFDNKVLWRWREDVMKHFFRHQNVGLVTTRFQKDHPGAFVTEHMITHKVFNSYDSNSVFPLYLYHQDGTRTSNFEPRRFKELTANLSAVPVPEDVFDYIYAVLHSPSYRETNAVFLKENFPRIPVVASDAEFARLVPLGRQLREVHLLRAGVLDDLSTTYSVPGDNSVERVAFQNGRVYINEAQYFGEIPESAWSFYVGGYQPAQKWLADRKGQTLSDDDLDRYQRIVMALAETGRIMQLIG